MAPEEPANATHLPDFPIYLSYWRAALLLFFTLPFLLGAISMSIASFKANSLSQFATAAIPTAFFYSSDAGAPAWGVQVPPEPWPDVCF